VESPPSPVAIDADEEGVQTILANLVDNAIKYTPSGVIALRRWAAGEAVVLQVADTGIGIPPEYEARSFERFYRVDQARTRGVGGTGLGLSIVKHLMQAFRGDVRVESQPGKGTLFELRFPAHKAEGENSP